MGNNTTTLAADDVLREFDYIVQSEANRCGHRPSPVFDRDDLLQAGRIGLLRAVDSYDEVKGLFAIWARTCVRHSLQEALRLEADPLTRTLRTWARKIDVTVTVLRNETGREPAENEVALRIGIDVRYLTRLRRYIRFSQPGVLEDDDMVWAENDTEQLALAGALRDQLWQALEGMEREDRDLLIGLFVEGCSMEQMAKRLATSSSTVHRRSVRALAKMRSSLEEP